MHASTLGWRSSTLLNPPLPPVTVPAPMRLRGHTLQVHHDVPADAWEYHMRRSLNDAAYRSLDYVPYCSTMPVQPNAPSAKFMWVSRARERCGAGLLRAGMLMAGLLWGLCGAWE